MLSETSVYATRTLAKKDALPIRISRNLSGLFWAMHMTAERGEGSLPRLCSVDGRLRDLYCKF